MPADFFSRFGKIWGSNGGLETPTDDNANAGFEYLGDTKPSKQLFNWLFQVVDEKANWFYTLFSNAASLCGLSISATSTSTLTDIIDVRANVPKWNNAYAQASGYRLNNIVADTNSVGKLWVSTADNNKSTPGAENAAWQDLLGAFATQIWADSRYVGKGVSTVDYTPLQAGINKSTGQIWLSYVETDDTVKYAFAQVGGNYVTNNQGQKGGIVSAAVDAGTATPSFLDGEGAWHSVASYAGLQSEVQRATTIESNLQSSKYDKTGGNIAGTVTVTAGAGVYVTVDPGGQTTGGYTNYGSLASQAGGRGGQFGFYVQEHVGSAFNGVIYLTQSDGTARFLSIPGDTSSRINDSVYGNLAYTNDLKSYTPVATYVSDLVTNASATCIPLPNGKMIQFVTTTVQSNGTNTHRIDYPVAFSGASTVVFNGNDTSQSRSFSLANNTTPDATGFYVAASQHGNSTAGDSGAFTLTYIAIGPRST